MGVFHIFKIVHQVNEIIIMKLYEIIIDLIKSVNLFNVDYVDLGIRFHNTQKSLTSRGTLPMPESICCFYRCLPNCKKLAS